jgi:hypothetical protein
MPDKWGAEMCAKRVIFGGFWREKGGEKGVFRASEGRKRRFFACGRGNWRARRRFRARIGQYVISHPGPVSPPRGSWKGETDARRGRSTCPYTLE